jgi:crotonobetainyl-CoA:carnitine CoA-transferase CaiB-like acyl-CoA transferase
MGVLSGYRVLDLTDEKGMLCTRLLADMGAGVVRIVDPVVSPAGLGTDFCYLNAGKRSIGLRLEDKAGQKLFVRLAKKADILVETGPPGYLDSLGLGYSVLGKHNPALLMASITHFGQTGPYRDYHSCDLAVEALGGWLSVTGTPRLPLRLFGNQACAAASLFTANAILLALWERHITGRGNYIDISVLECVAATLDHVLVRFFYEGTVSGRQGSRHWNNAFRVFPCRDGYILLSVFQHWETLVAWLESEGMAADLTDEKWRDRDVRIRGIDHIAGVLERWTLTHTAAELVEKGQLMHFPWARVESVSGVLGSPQLTARDYFTEVSCRGSRSKMAGAPVRMGRSPWRTAVDVPATGGGDIKSYLEEFGLSGSEIADLMKKGVIQMKDIRRDREK